MINKKRKKAQQEVMGFVVIVLLVIVIGIMIFTFSLQRSLRKPSYIEDIRVNDLMNSIMQYSTGCEFEDVKGIIERCYNSEKCGNQDACDYLNEELRKILNATLGKEREYGNIIGYKLVDESGKINISEGEERGNLVASKYLVPIFSGTTTTNVEVTLYIYFGKIQD